MLASQWLPTSAWDKDGHEAIGMTTMSALQNGPTHEVKRLMHGKDAVDVAAWAHKVNVKFPWTSDLHFQRQPDGQCKKADLSRCDGNKCLVQGIKHFYGRLVGKQEVDIDWGDLKLTDADCLKFLINLIGDMHQPMHFGSESTNSGKDITVLFRGKKMSLYDFWDKELAATVIKDSPGFWWGGWTHVQRTRAEYEKDSERFKKDGIAMFAEWADESARFACENVYRDPTTGKDIMTEMDGVHIFHINDHLFETWKREMLSKMLVAGARTAIVLNSILQHREGEGGQGGAPAHQLQDGTAVQMEGEEDDAAANLPKLSRAAKADIPKGSKATQGPEALAINFGLFTIVFSIFMYVQRLWGAERKDADRAKVMDLEGGKKT